MIRPYDFPAFYEIYIHRYDFDLNLDDVSFITIDPTEKDNIICFRASKKKDSLLNLSVKKIVRVTPSTQSSGLIKKKEFSQIEITHGNYIDGKQNYHSILFSIDNKLRNVIMDHIEYLKEADYNNAVQKQIKIFLHPHFCHECFKTEYDTTIHLSKNCFLKLHGNTILFNKSAEYHGGHKAYPSGGSFRRHEDGQLSLNEKSIIFVKDSKNPLNRIDIIIPFSSISMSSFGIAEEGTSTGIGAAIPIEEINTYVGGLFRIEGKANRLKESNTILAYL